MRKLCVLIITLALSACAITDGSTVPTQMSDQEIVNTMVAETLDAGLRAATETYIALLPTLAPATSTETPLPPDTATPLPTSTPTITPTATISASDLSYTLGEPDWVDTFDDGGNWYTYDLPSSKAEVVNGQFEYTMKIAGPDQDWAGDWTVAWPSIKDFYLEVTISNTDRCEGKDRFGMMFRAPDNNAGYISYFSCDGHFRVLAWDGSLGWDLIPWTSGSAINTGPNQVNRMGILAEGNILSIYANGTLLKSVVDDTFTNAGRFGLVVGSENTINFMTIFDDLKYWVLP